MYVGFSFFILFLLSGAYMMATFPELYDGNEAMRFIYRANHIYILMASLINLGVGSYLIYSEHANIKRIQKLGGGLIIVAPLLLFVAFIVEPSNMLIDRPISFWGILFLLVGVVLQVIGKLICSIKTNT